jgi:hypothetical protein
LEEANANRYSISMTCSYTVREEEIRQRHIKIIKNRITIMKAGE